VLLFTQKYSFIIISSPYTLVQIGTKNLLAHFIFVTAVNFQLFYPIRPIEFILYNDLKSNIEFYIFNEN